MLTRHPTITLFPAHTHTAAIFHVLGSRSYVFGFNPLRSLRWQSATVPVAPAAYDEADRAVFFLEAFVMSALNEYALGSSHRIWMDTGGWGSSPIILNECKIASFRESCVIGDREV